MPRRRRPMSETPSSLPEWSMIFSSYPQTECHGLAPWTVTLVATPGDPEKSAAERNGIYCAGLQPRPQQAAVGIAAQGDTRADAPSAPRGVGRRRVARSQRSPLSASATAPGNGHRSARPMVMRPPRVARNVTIPGARPAAIDRTTVTDPRATTLSGQICTSIPHRAMLTIDKTTIGCTLHCELGH
jgi:hypothetical protein